VRRALALLVAAVVCLLAARAGAGKVVVWHAYRGAEQDALERILDDFRRAHPGDEVESLAIPFDAYASKLEAAIPHGHGPDVFLDAHERLGDYRDKGLVAPIDPLLLPTGAFDATSVAAVTLDGRAYGVPLALKCLALYLRAPTWPAYATPPTSLDRVVHEPPLPSLAYEASNAYMHAPILHAFGGAILDDDARPPRYAFADGPARESLAWVLDALDRGAIPDEASGALVTQLFATGSGRASPGADAAISGPWLAADLPASLEYRVVPIPPVHAGGPPSRPFLTVEGAFLAPHPRDAALANAMLAALGSRDAAIVRASVGRQVVATTSAWSDPNLANDRLLAGFAQAARLAVPMPTSPAMRAAWEPTTRAIQKVLRRDASPADAIVEARHRFEDVTRPLPPTRDPKWILFVLGAVALFGAMRAVSAARDPATRRHLRDSYPAYKYLAHAVFSVVLLVVVPLLIGAATSLFAGRSGELRYVGLGNYFEIVTARGGSIFASGSFYFVLGVTVLWTICNVALHLAIGVVLALLLARPVLKLRAVYRVLLVVPWAVPSYVSALAWKGMFHRQLGAINAVLAAFGVHPIAWFSKFATAFAANVATNVWLGFPFMMVVTLGALAAIPKEVLEAAEVDGATPWQRFWRVTMPLLRPTLAPAVVLGAVWTFNMFNVVFLVSGGEPDGTTEILVSEAYRWAFTRQAQYGYASAYAVLIFILLATTTRLLRAQSEERA
jgi:arabinogalactan oligomer/maltooligosaccharide transport system permease protein